VRAGAPLHAASMYKALLLRLLAAAALIASAILAGVWEAGWLPPGTRSFPVHQFPLYAPHRTNEANAKITKDETLPRIARLKAACGALCDTDKPIQRVHPGKPFGTVRAPVDCPALIRNHEWDAQRETRAAPDWEDLPRELQNDFLMGGSGHVRLVRRELMDAAYLGGDASTKTWSSSMLSHLMKKAKRRELDGNYGTALTNQLMDAVLAANVSGKRALVVGSESPWVEAILLEAGAKHVVTLEYGRIHSQHPQVSTLTPDEFRARFEAGKLHPFDVVVSFSSVEHSGLGRYGDALNPWGDIVAIARAWCVAKPGAALILGVPMAALGKACSLTTHVHPGSNVVDVPRPAPTARYL
jgi:hypothetical protein